MTLKAVEPLIEEKYKGPKGTVEGAAAAAVESILHKQPYKQAELEEAIGASLSSLFEGNNSQQKSVAFANSHGESLPGLKRGSELGWNCRRATSDWKKVNGVAQRQS